MAKKEKEAKQKSSYFKDMKTELKKVVWPTPKELLNSTVAVIAFVLIFAVIVFVLDFCFDNLNKYGITTFQEAVQSALATDETSEDEETDSTESTEDEDTESESTESESTESEETSSEAEDEEVSTEGLETEEIEVESSSDTEETE